MRRGDLITVAVRGEYTGKPRPALVIQADAFRSTASVTACLLTTEALDAPLLRYPVEPTMENGLAKQSWVMIDKITTVRRAKSSTVIGRLERSQMRDVGRLLTAFLGLA